MIVTLLTANNNVEMGGGIFRTVESYENLIRHVSLPYMVNTRIIQVRKSKPSLVSLRLKNNTYLVYFSS